MKVIVQRVKEASVIVEGALKASIGKGLLLLVGIGKNDTEKTAEHMAEKISKLRIFEDENGKMNLDIKQVSGEILSVSQFTLYGNTGKGNRPGFDDAADPDIAQILWNKLNDAISGQSIIIKKGVFAAHMEVSSINDGPVTFLVETDRK